MNEEQNPADPVGDEAPASEQTTTDAPQDDAASSQQPTPEGAAEPVTPADGAADGEAEEKPDAIAGDDTPAAEDEKSRSALRRERRKQHLADVEERASKSEAALKAIRSAAEGDTEPKESDFSDYTDYAAAKAVFAMERRRNTTQATEAQAQHKAARDERQQIQQAAWQEQVQEAKAKYTDFEEVAYRPTNPVTPVMQEVILSSDSGADLAYYLGMNVSTAAKIAKLPPLDAARELGRIEANLTAPKARTATKAPAPIRTVNPSAGTGEKSPGDMSYAEYVKWRRGPGG